MRLNLNAQVRVKLTDRGRAMLERELARIGVDKLDPPVTWQTLWRTSPDGWTTMQLWEVCHYLGRGMGNGLDLVCETEVEVLG